MVLAENELTMDEEAQFEQEIARDFRQKVQELLVAEVERDQVYAALRIYHDTMSIAQLVDELKFIVNHPKKLLLFEYVRPLVPLKHQTEYDILAPRAATRKLRVIRLTQRGGDGCGLGFSIRGGCEHGTDIFVTDVIRESQADNQGLRVGDQIARVNGFALDKMTHNEALSLIRQRTHLILKVRSIGMLPVKLDKRDDVTWKYVEPSEQTGKFQPDRKVFINVIGNTLGCSVTSGPPYNPGIFIQGARGGGLAEEAGLEVGDQLIECNGTSFANITHADAVMCLKSRKQLSLVVRKGVGLDMFDLSDQQSVNTLTSRMTTGTVKSRQSRESERTLQAGGRQRRMSASSVGSMAESTVIMADVHADTDTRLRRTGSGRSQQLSIEYNDSRLREDAMKLELELKQKRERERLEAERIKEQDKEMRRQKQQLMEHRLIKNVHDEGKIEYNPAAPSGDQMSRASTLTKHSYSSNASSHRPVTLLPMEAKSSGQRSDGVKRMNGSQPADNSQRTSTGQRMNSGQQIEKSSYMQIDSLSSASGSSGYSSEQGRSTKLKSTNLADPEKVDLCKLVNGRELKTLTYTKEGPLGVALEGGTDSKKHNGRVVVAEIFPTGSIYKYGGLEKGSQLMMVNGRSLLGITLTQAQEVLKEVILGPGDSLTLVVATQKKDDDTTYL